MTSSGPLTAQECVLQGTREVDHRDPWQEIFVRAGIDENSFPLEMTEKRERLIGEEIFEQAMRMRGPSLANLKLITYKMLWRYYNPTGEVKGEEKEDDEDHVLSDQEIVDSSMEDLKEWIFDHLYFPGNLLGEVADLMPEQDADYQNQVAISVLDGDNFNRLFNRYAATTCLPLVPKS